MREILFRGKLISNNEWIEGYYIHTKRHHCIITGCINDGYVVYGHYANDVAMEVVAPETVGQYTGMKDINGKKIFEGDIVRTQPFSDRPYSKKAKYKQHIGVVEYHIGHFKSIHDDYEQDYEAIWRVKINDYDGYGCCNWSAFFKCEVIGNIYDNPELLEVQND